MKKKVLVALVLLVCLAGMAAPSVSAEWTETEDGLRWTNEDGSIRTEKGWFKADGKYYYLNADGSVRTGIGTIGGKKYYFRKADNGSAFFGWKRVNGKQYYFRPEFAGGAATGWIDRKDGRRYYFDENAQAVTGVREIDGNTYYFDEKGVMQTGMVYMGELVYDLDENGVLKEQYATGEEGGDVISEEEAAQFSWDMDEAAVKALYPDGQFLKEGSMLVTSTESGLRFFIFDKDSGKLTAYGTDSPQADQTKKFSETLEAEGYTLLMETEIHKYSAKIYKQGFNFACAAGNGSSSILLYASPELSMTVATGGVDAVVALAAENGLSLA